MKRFLKEYFTFSRTETGVMIVVSFLICAGILVRETLESRVRIKSYLPAVSLAEIEQFSSELESVRFKRTQEKSENRITAPENVLRPKPFDPNTVSREELLETGLSEFVVQNIIKYRAAGGRFMKADDVGRIYGLDPDLFAVIEPYITIVEDKVAVSSEKPPDSRTVEKENFTLEINSATAGDFKRIRGIGEVLAGRIIKYRNLLGGFTSAGQLAEVYGISDSLVKANAGHLRLDTGQIRKISLNRADYKSLLRHPYLDKPEVDAIMHFRKFSKDSVSPSDLRESVVLSDSILDKIWPYLQK